MWVMNKRKFAWAGTYNRDWLAILIDRYTKINTANRHQHLHMSMCVRAGKQYVSFNISYI